jgi:hypothetical protein
MTTSNVPPRSYGGQPIRLRMSPAPGVGVMDGGWWPRSSDSVHELGELVDNFPVEHGRVVRARFSSPDWDATSRRIPTAPDATTAELSPQDDPHLIRLGLEDHRTLRLLVVPPGMSEQQGEEALLAAATPGYAHSAQCLLTTVTNSPEHEAADQWTVGGGRRLDEGRPASNG